MVTSDTIAVRQVKSRAPTSRRYVDSSGIEELVVARLKNKKIT